MIFLYRITYFFFILSAVFVSLCCSKTLWASEEKSLLVFHSGLEQTDNAFNALLALELQNRIPSHSLKTFNVNELSQIQLKKWLENSNNCVLTIGLNSLEKILATRTKIPVFSTLVSQTNLDNLTDIYRQLGNPVTGIYEEQSFKRQLLLSKSIREDLKHVTVILGRKTRYMLNDYKKISLEQSINLSFNILKLQESPQRIFSRLKNNNGFLLTLNDNRHYSEQNLPALLVSSYKKQIPIIGSKISDADSTALASIYTPFDSLARESAIAMQNICRDDVIPKAQYNRQYKVRINQQIAKHLGYEYLDETELEKAVIVLEQNKPDRNKL